MALPLLHMENALELCRLPEAAKINEFLETGRVIGDIVPVAPELLQDYQLPALQ